MSQIVAMFPGQASQYVGMGKTLFVRHESVRQRFSKASEILSFDLSDLCFNGPSATLTQTENTQPAILVLSVAMFEVAQKEGFQPSFLAGHSLGELSALTASGVLDFEDAVRLARIRGEAMAACSTGIKTGMSAVTNVEASQVEVIVAKLQAEGYSVQIANYNTPLQTVLSGSAEGLQSAGERLVAIGGKVHPLNVSGAFHSTFMSSAVERMVAAMEPMKFGDMSIPVMNGLEGRLYTKDDDIKSILAAQLTGPVRWTTVLDRLSEERIALWLEMGPKDVLKKIGLQTFPDSKFYAYDDEADNEASRTQLAAILQNKERLPNLVGLCLGAAVSTRNTNWDEAAYHKGVVEPYKNIQNLYDKAAKEGRTPNHEEMQEALALLRQIFMTKGIPPEEQFTRFSLLLKASETDRDFPEYLTTAKEGC
ncbi:ACP S-malonyltransferase [Paenibacillus sp. FSL R7-0337]|uniref:ACP S-malonyltransferase n=1 Tax=Paenibacillus sp. FSL R7-0337 TaxID=1926588 RepID=UPI00096D4727|nr:ACP S-malonyltransferase [Paenibacillus sp. FSL R7-0337]OMF91664.1 [acyl-carrier-protein] S-malonyltransferase [Paenibacillus sp. FSL R7-0337]